MEELIEKFIMKRIQISGRVIRFHYKKLDMLRVAVQEVFGLPEKSFNVHHWLRDKIGPEYITIYPSGSIYHNAIVGDKRISIEIGEDEYETYLKEWKN